ncbi:hypothetical protein P872_12450 [Rhodonellum psychrophilum GCM71 = DSM 17998]|uniref:Histidine kinase n=2 Tax=Rhodonellum TaxID=336827 RepID=U5BT11_9BACT|nr:MULTISPECIES: response regulator [Rhodonellum]ERM80669.1 hypothetical protein P872_12450 [Rhodonellum psychrophilum GCM71 = DSM 17998]SDZ32879.1 PAS domain S-box-containing protein [Rhodonellum ikkaensis]
MFRDSRSYTILVIDDNSGDRLLIETYLEEAIKAPKIVEAKNFAEANLILTQSPKYFDTVLLDLSLPDKSGENLIMEILRIAANIPVIVLTGYSDMAFGRKSLSLGISDYLLKDDLNATNLFKSIIYGIERNAASQRIYDSEKRYKELFHLSPIPMWVYEMGNLGFLDVNQAAIKHYGYSKEEFLSMTIRDIRQKEENNFLDNAIETSTSDGEINHLGIFRHLKKNQEIIDVEISSNILDFNGLKAKLVLANDVTQRRRYIEAIEEQNVKLKEISWIQSHVVRAPLARMMGLINMLTEDDDFSDSEKKIFINHIIESGHELDKIIRNISNKTENINIPEK